MRLLPFFLAGACLAQAPDANQLERIQSQLGLLESLITRSKAPADLRADVAIYAKAAHWILRHPEEFYKPEYKEQLASILDRGTNRAAELAQGSASWARQTGRLSRAYVSRVDGSLQPYGVIIPESYDPSKPTRLDVVLHGRAAQMNEVNFLFAHDSPKPVPSEQKQIVLEVFGRTNNAYRWAGETDVFEAIESVRSRYNVDPDRVVLRGFSMGGAGAWHIACTIRASGPQSKQAPGSPRRVSMQNFRRTRPITFSESFTFTMQPITPKTRLMSRSSDTAERSIRSFERASSSRKASRVCRICGRSS